MNDQINARQVALTLLEKFSKEEITLEKGFKAFQETLSPQDMSFAKELTYGTLRRSLECDAYLRQLNQNQPMRIKRAIKWIGKMALYQFLYMSRVPLYAIVNESVKLAKKIASPQAKFLNALLRKLHEHYAWKPLERSERFSMPLFLLNKLNVDDDVLLALLKRPALMIRTKEKIEHTSLKLLEDFGFCKSYRVEPASALEELLAYQGVYVQNITPIRLMKALHSQFLPHTVLDMCAAPGGKSSLCALLFPHAELTVNEPDTQRLKILKENLRRLNVLATIMQENGQSFPLTKKYDLILLDLPCSNTGVCHKKPEAKYRLTQQRLEWISSLQATLIERSVALLNEGGELWMMTCSILSEENLKLIDVAHACLSLEQIHVPLTLYPDEQGADGGFCVSFRKRSHSVSTV